MPDAGFPVEMIHGVPVVTAPAEIDVTNADRLRAALLESAAAGHATFVVDMTGTGFCDSAGLNVLVLAHKRALAEGGELRLVIPAVAVLRAFAVTGVDTVIPHFRNLDDALAQTPAATIQPPRGRLTPEMRMLPRTIPDTPDPATPA